jgi:hypothetical protein
MKKLIIVALAATSAFAVAAPAAAQQFRGGYGQIRSDQLQIQLQAGIRSGAISRAEATPLRQQLFQLMRLERLYARDGISGRERADLQYRINRLRQGIRFAERSGGGYGRDDDRYGRGDDGYGRDGGYDRDRDGWDDRDGNRDGRWDVDTRNDSNRDGWDDRDTDRDGRWDDDNDGDGRDRAGYELRVGQRVTADLDALPYAYRNQYRDGEGVYYRTDGRQIYQIDARTQTVVRVYAMNR